MGYKSAPRYDSGGDRDGYDKDNRGFVVSTTLCGHSRPNGRSTEVNAQGKTLQEALMALAREVDRTLGLIASRATTNGQKAHICWIEFLKLHHQL